MDERELILGQYRVFSEAKENFIDRHFTTNRFYFVFEFTLLLVAYILYVYTSAKVPIIVSSVFGMAVSILWWLNIDSYQLLIKVKYSKVLEYLETKLPEQPYHIEYTETSKIKKTKNLAFVDVQKVLASLLFAVFLIIFVFFVVSAANPEHGLLF